MPPQAAHSLLGRATAGGGAHDGDGDGDDDDDDDDGQRVGLGAWLGAWRACALLQPQVTARHLTYLGYCSSGPCGAPSGAPGGAFLAVAAAGLAPWPRRRVG
jgi:hypothetical protein